MKEGGKGGREGRKESRIRERNEKREGREGWKDSRIGERNERTEGEREREVKGKERGKEEGERKE